METTKQYKNLGNTIRESVFRAKEAPTMLPDETIEQLGLGEDDILSMEENEINESSGDFVVKHAKTKRGNISIDIFNTRADANKFLKRVKKAGGNGIVSIEKDTRTGGARPRPDIAGDLSYSRKKTNEARSSKSSFEQRNTAEQLATQLSRQINNIHLPDSDSVRYERPGNSWKKDETKATKQLDKIISQLESLSKLVLRSTL